MTRPASFDDSPPINRCGTCAHCHYVRYKGDLLCFHGDSVITHRDGLGTWDESDVEFEGESVELMSNGDAYDRVRRERVVNQGDTCDEWESREKAEADRA